jgi:hypothetical protein
MPHQTLVTRANQLVERIKTSSSHLVRRAVLLLERLFPQANAKGPSSQRYRLPAGVDGDRERCVWRDCCRRFSWLSWWQRRSRAPIRWPVPGAPAAHTVSRPSPEVPERITSDHHILRPTRRGRGPTPRSGVRPRALRSGRADLGVAFSQPKPPAHDQIGEGTDDAPVPPEPVPRARVGGDRTGLCAQQ